MGGVVSSLANLPPHPTYTRRMKDLVWINDHLPALLLTCDASAGPPPSRPTYTILYSHGNAEDLGSVSPRLKVLASGHCLEALEIHCNKLVY